MSLQCVDLKTCYALLILLEHESFKKWKISSYVIGQLNAENRNFNIGEIGKTTLPQLQVNNSYTQSLDGSDIKSASCTLNKTMSNGHNQNTGKRCI